MRPMVSSSELLARASLMTTASMPRTAKLATGLGPSMTRNSGSPSRLSADARALLRRTNQKMTIRKKRIEKKTTRMKKSVNLTSNKSNSLKRMMKIRRRTNKSPRPSSQASPSLSTIRNQFSSRVILTTTSRMCTSISLLSTTIPKTRVTSSRQA